MAQDNLPPVPRRERIAVAVFIAIATAWLAGVAGVTMSQHLIGAAVRQMLPIFAGSRFDSGIVWFIEIVVLTALYAVVWSGTLLTAAIMLPAMGLPLVFPFQKRRT